MTSFLPPHWQQVRTGFHADRLGIGITVDLGASLIRVWRNPAVDTSGQIYCPSGNYVDTQMETWFTMTMTTNTNSEINWAELFKTWTNDMILEAAPPSRIDGELTEGQVAFLEAWKTEARNRGFTIPSPWRRCRAR